MSEVAQRQQSPSQVVISQVRSEDFQAQVAMALPENMPPSRFVRATVTALLQNPELAEVEANSLWAALLKCAQDGLLPDGREAAITAFNDSKVGGKVAAYLPMIGGFRKVAGEHGWSLETVVVYQADEFSYELGLDPRIEHRPAPVNSNRGELVAAYAIGRHRDGRRVIEVYEASQIAKAKGVAKTDKVWKQWPAQMWEKTVGKRLFAKLPLDPADKRVLSLVDAAELEPGEAANMLYGPHGTARATELEAPTQPAPPGDAADDGQPGGAHEAAAELTASQQAGAGGVGAAAAPAPGPEDDPEPGSEAAAGEQSSFPVPASVVEEAASTKVEFGSHAGKTLTQILEEKPDWFEWALRNPHKFEEAQFASVGLFVQHRLPEVWAEHEERPT